MLKLSLKRSTAHSQESGQKHIGSFLRKLLEMSSVLLSHLTMAWLCFALSTAAKSRVALSDARGLWHPFCPSGEHHGLVGCAQPPSHHGLACSVDAGPSRVHPPPTFPVKLLCFPFPPWDHLCFQSAKTDQKTSSQLTRVKIWPQKGSRGVLSLHYNSDLLGTNADP